MNRPTSIADDLATQFQATEAEVSSDSPSEPGTPDFTLHRVAALSTTFELATVNLGKGFARLGKKGIEFVIMLPEPPR